MQANADSITKQGFVVSLEIDAQHKLDQTRILWQAFGIPAPRCGPVLMTSLLKCVPVVQNHDYRAVLARNLRALAATVEADGRQ